MYTTDVTLSLGSTLAFNDLPSSIKVEFTLTPARNWGLQDIMSKFNSGHLRSVNVIADSTSLNPNQSLSENGYYFPGTTTSTTGDATGGNATGGNPGAAGGGVSSTGGNTINGSASTTKENEIQPKVDSNPNSTKPVVVDEAQQKVGGTTTTTSGTTDTTPKNESEKANKQADSQQDPTADANATSKRKYTYLIRKEGNKNFVLVLDQDGILVCRTEKTKESDPNILISQAKVAAGDN